MLNKRPSWSPLWSATTRRGDRFVIRSTNAIDLPHEHCNFNCMKLVGFREERLKCCDSKCMVSATEIISTIKRNGRDPRLRVFFQGLPTQCIAVTICLVLLSPRDFPVSSAPVRDARTIIVYSTPERPERLLSGNCLQSIVQARLVQTVDGCALPIYPPK